MKLVSMTHYCACVAMPSFRLQVQYCERCDDSKYFDDYTRHNGNFIESEDSSLVDNVRNTIKRRSYPNRCDRGYQLYEFNDSGQLCKWLNHVKNRSELPVPLTTIAAAGTTTTSSSRKDDIPDDGNGTNQQGRNSGKRRDDVNNEGVDDGKGGISVGVAVALAVIFYILGLITMCLIMKLCIPVLQKGMCMQGTREDYKVNPDIHEQSIPQSVDHHVANAVTEQGTPERHFTDTMASSSHRTSYEGLRQENATDGVYNALDPAYQTHECANIDADVRNHNDSHDYFVLEEQNNKQDRKTNNLVADKTQCDVNKSDSYKAAEYLTLEKSTSETRDRHIGASKTNRDRCSSNVEHDYFVLEQANNDSISRDADKGYSKINESLDSSANDYFVLEKENNSEIERR